MFTICPAFHGHNQINEPVGEHTPGYYFDVTYRNTTSHSRYIVKIGIRSDVGFGRFDCVGQTGPLIVAADYIVRFDVSDLETIAQAKPPLGIDPGQAVRFTISYAMSAIGECGPWETRISGIIIFDNGEVVTTEPKVVTRSDYARLMRERPKESLILNSLQSLDSRVRVAAIDQLVASNLDQLAIERILKGKLLDEDSAVRAEAARVAARMHIKALAPQIALQMTSAIEPVEKSAYCIALGYLRDPGTCNALLSALLDTQFPDPSQAKAALVNIESAYVLTRIRAQLPKYLQWIEDHSEEKRKRALYLCDILVAYRDIQSSRTLSILLNRHRNDFVAKYLVSSIRSVTATDHLITDRFFLSMRPAIQQLLDSKDAALRLAVIQILGRMMMARGKVEPILIAGLEDSDQGVRKISARIVGERGYKSLSDRVVRLWRDSTLPAEKAEYCEALKALGIACQ